MLKLLLALCCAVTLLTACSTSQDISHPYASGTALRSPEQCVPYARRISGVALYGDAYTWWDQAEPNYRRGRAPRPGAVLVLARTDKMQSGHVAVVNNVLGPRLIDVTHSNWGNDHDSRRIVYHSMRVADISQANDWSQVRFWNAGKNCFGFPYAARGFIYGERD